MPASWHLRFGYPGGHILGMNPDSHLAPNGHAAVVRSTDYSGGSGPGGRTFAVGVGVQGMPTHPARCSFDGKTCHIGWRRHRAGRGIPVGTVIRVAGQRVTLPALMHEVHTCRRRGVPSTLARTVWMLGLKRRGVRRCE